MAPGNPVQVFITDTPHLTPSHPTRLFLPTRPLSTPPSPVCLLQQQSLLPSPGRTLPEEEKKELGAVPKRHPNPETCELGQPFKARHIDLPRWKMAMQPPPTPVQPLLHSRHGRRTCVGSCLYRTRVPQNLFWKRKAENYPGEEYRFKDLTNLAKSRATQASVQVSS